jgi:hypothetical protein
MDQKGLGLVFGVKGLTFRTCEQAASGGWAERLAIAVAVFPHHITHDAVSCSNHTQCWQLQQPQLLPGRTLYFA